MIRKIGLGLFIIALIVFTALLGMGRYELTEASLNTQTDYHQTAILEAAQQTGMLGETYRSNVVFISDLKKTFKTAQQNLQIQADNGIPEGVGEWDFKLGDWKIKEYVLSTVKASDVGPIAQHPFRYWLLSIGLGILGGLLYILPSFFEIPGIKHNGIYHNALTRGLTLKPRSFFLGAAILGIIAYGVSYIGNWIWPVVTLLVIGLIIYLVLYREEQKDLTPPKSASPSITAWLGVFTGIYLIGFYILLYWKPEYLTSWITINDPLSRSLSGNPASQWFLYGTLYTIAVLVMGIRMIAKYRHNRYQMLRTTSVMFFQTTFAFIIPEILIRLNQPYFDFKNIWPLDYDFFFDWNINSLMNSGGLGIFMLVWGIVLALIGVPVFTYFFGKRWYCSWVCGCGGLAETLGDPFRQLSDKSLRAWKYERYIIHGVLAFAVIMTFLVLYTYFTGSQQILFLNSDSVRSWYGFIIGAGFSGVVGTGFYPLMGNRVWCRFGCPLAAYLGLVQRFQSRFRITVNGSQCISCGNCSTYCEMGIDVRHYAQRGQDIVRSSCVGCGVCAAVCPRGVLRLENSSADVKTRTQALRTIHVKESEIGILG